MLRLQEHPQSSSRISNQNLARYAKFVFLLCVDMGVSACVASMLQHTLFIRCVDSIVDLHRNTYCQHMYEHVCYAFDVDNGCKYDVLALVCQYKSGYVLHTCTFSIVLHTYTSHVCPLEQSSRVSPKASRTRFTCVLTAKIKIFCSPANACIISVTHSILCRSSLR